MEPELREDERGGEQRGSHNPERRTDERDERQEPDDVLRREKARERKKAGDGRSGRG
jgi:hypothetical protein